MTQSSQKNSFQFNFTFAKFKCSFCFLYSFCLSIMLAAVRLVAEIRVKYILSLKVEVATGEFTSEFLLWEICLFNICFWKYKGSTTMERASLFKEYNYGKVISDVFISSVSNHRKICGHLVPILSRLFWSDLTTEVCVHWKLFRSSSW